MQRRWWHHCRRHWRSWTVGTFYIINKSRIRMLMLFRSSVILEICHWINSNHTYNLLYHCFILSGIPSLVNVQRQGGGSQKILGEIAWCQTRWHHRSWTLPHRRQSTNDERMGPRRFQGTNTKEEETYFDHHQRVLHWCWIFKTFWNSLVCILHWSGMDWIGCSCFLSAANSNVMNALYCSSVFFLEKKPNLFFMPFFGIYVSLAGLQIYQSIHTGEQLF